MGIEERFNLKEITRPLTFFERQKLPLIKVGEKIYFCEKKKDDKNTARY
jgi:hypothetical protein